jgi:pimeloyl-ACP methyl ester carboxylesterase
MTARLVLLPGLAGDGVMWRSQLAALAQWAPIVTDVHMRHDSIPDMAAAVLAEIEGPLVLCGASMGGMIAMEAARQAPHRVAALALLGTSARPEDDDMRKVRENAIRLFEEGREREVIEPNVHFAFHADHAQDPAIAQAYLEFVLRAGARQLIRQNRAVIARPDARMHLPQVKCPALVMHGDSDQLVPLERAREIAQLVPNARLEIVPRCGHMLTMERPDAVSAALAGWLGEIGI